MNWQRALIAVCVVAVFGIGAAIYVGTRPPVLPPCISDTATTTDFLNSTAVGQECPK